MLFVDNIVTYHVLSPNGWVFFSSCQMDILNGGILEGKIKKLIRRKTYDRNEVKMRKLQNSRFQKKNQ